MRSLCFVMLAAVLGACGGGGAPPNNDANPNGPRCSMQNYDLCLQEHDCMTAICQNFGDFQVCTTGCNAGGEPCPKDKTGQPATCDNGLCKPSAPNMCHLE